ncbi:hypothetical protein PSHT_10954 [Puccinia striiformis]|uniref:Flavin reductase like domain-containing protein n=1 Tax=Puccinia striiformis TaxID=27350 RepID=A0A2S4V6F1_9BASI|nr:hypothetical protein PSHT_10954 [Puccinia striiformis]
MVCRSIGRLGRTICITTNSTSTSWGTTTRSSIRMFSITVATREESTMERRSVQMTREPLSIRKSSNQPEAFRDLMRGLSYPVTVVTVELEDGDLHGATVSSFSSIALDPEPLISISLRRPSRLASHLILKPLQSFSIYLLQHHPVTIDIATLFSRPKDRISPAVFIHSIRSAWLDISNQNFTTGNGSTLFIAQVIRSNWSTTIDNQEIRPLMYHNRSYTTIKTND